MTCGHFRACVARIGRMLSGMTNTAAHPEQTAARRVRLAVVTISDTLQPDTDECGNYLRRAVQAAGHEVAESAIVQDDAVAIRTLLVRLLREVDVVMTTGGISLAGRDVALPVVESLLVKPISGFGELFRVLSYESARGAAMLARATGGLTRSSLLFSIPGDLKSAEIAWEGILKDELSHLVFEVLRSQAHAPMPAPTRPQLQTHTEVLPDLDAPPLSVPSHAEQHSAGLGRHAGVSAAPSTASATPERVTETGLGRHSADRKR